MKHKTKWAFCPNRNIMELHTTFRMTSSSIEMYAEDLKSNPDYINDLYVVNGVCGNIFVNPYSITVTKGEMFDWENIKPYVEAIVLQHFIVNAKLVDKANNIITEK